MPVVLQFAVVPALVPEYEAPAIAVALVHVPVAVFPELLETLQPTRKAPVVPPAAVAPVAIVVQPAGREGAVVLALRYAKTIFRSPVAVALNVPLAAAADTLPSRAICAETDEENSNSNASATRAALTDFESKRTQGQLRSNDV